MLVASARDGGAEEAAWAIAALVQLARDTEGRALIVAEQATEAFVRLAESSSRWGRGLAAILLLRLTEDDSMLRALPREAGCIPILVELARERAPELVIVACEALANLVLDAAGREEVFAAGGMEVLQGLLEDGPAESKSFAAIALVRLAQSAADHAVMRELGCIEALVASVRKARVPSVLRPSIEALGRAAKAGLEGRARIHRAGGIEALLAVLRGKQAMESKAYAAMALMAGLSEHPADIATLCAAGCVEAIIKTVRRGNGEAKADASLAFMGFANDPEARRRLAASGGIELLVELAQEPGAECRRGAIGALSRLTLDPQHRRAILAAGGAEALVSVLDTGSPPEEGTWAVNTLLRLAQETEGCKALTAAGAEEKLVTALRAGSPFARSVVLRLLTKLAALRQSRWALRIAGGMELLASMAQDSDAAVRRRAAELLERIDTDTEAVPFGVWRSFEPR